MILLIFMMNIYINPIFICRGITYKEIPRKIQIAPKIFQRDLKRVQILFNELLE